MLRKKLSQEPQNGAAGVEILANAMRTVFKEAMEEAVAPLSITISKLSSDSGKLSSDFGKLREDVDVRLKTNAENVQARLKTNDENVQAQLAQHRKDIAEDFKEALRNS